MKEPSMPDDGKVVYTTEEVSLLLGVHYNTVLTMIERGDIPAVKIGRKWFIGRSTLHMLLEGKPITK